MRSPAFLLSFLMLIFLLPAPAVFAQADDLSLYSVLEVPADVTADSAAHARDKAVIQAQRAGLEQLLARFGVETTLAGKLSNDDIATLVQNFEVSTERSSSVRYIGSFNIQYRPIATREWLNSLGATYTEARSKPLLVLPVFVNKGHPILWEEHTKWWEAWESARNDSLVPFLLPSGDLDDISVLSGEEAVSGKADAIRTLAEKYQAGGAAVVILDGDLDNPGPPFKLKIVRYDDEGNATQPNTITLPPAGDKASIEPTLAQAVKQVRNGLEGNWRQVVAKATQPPGAKMQVTVPITSIDQWTQIKQKLGTVHEIDRTNVLMLARGATNIELEFHGGVEQLQDDLAKQNLVLSQQGMGGIWVLQPAVGSRL